MGIVIANPASCCRKTAARAAGCGNLICHSRECRNPVCLTVAACKGGVDDLIIENKTAVVFNPTDEISIYNALRQLFGRRKMAQQIAAAAQQHLRENYTVSNMISSTLKVYRDAQTWLKKQDLAQSSKP